MGSTGQDTPSLSADKPKLTPDCKLYWIQKHLEQGRKMCFNVVFEIYHHVSGIGIIICFVVSRKINFLLFFHPLFQLNKQTKFSMQGQICRQAFTVQCTVCSIQMYIYNYVKLSRRPQNLCNNCPEVILELEQLTF
jgi:hypothetical protein